MICNSKKILLDAIKNGYAVPAFNIHNLDNARACIEVCTELHSPLILAFTPQTMAMVDVRYLLAIANAASCIANIPVCLHLDHFTDVNSIHDCLKHGVKSVMIDGSKLDYEANVAITKKAVKLARNFDATVEGELGKLLRVKNNKITEKADVNMHTDPNEILDFVQKTNVDSLAVAYGNAHGAYLKPPVLDYQVLTNATKLLHEKNIYNFPFVLHGGSGLSKVQLDSSIKSGIAKINVGTELKAPFALSLYNFFKNNPHEYDPRKFLPGAVDALKKVVKEKVLMCKSNNRYQ